MEKWTMPKWLFQVVVIVVIVALIIFERYIVQPQNLVDYWKVVGAAVTVLVVASFIWEVWLWRFPALSLGVPNLRGTWQATWAHQKPGEPVETGQNAYVVIQQTRSSMHVIVFWGNPQGQTSTMHDKFPMAIQDGLCSLAGPYTLQPGGHARVFAMFINTVGNPAQPTLDYHNTGAAGRETGQITLVERAYCLAKDYQDAADKFRRRNNLSLKEKLQFFVVFWSSK